MAVCLALCVWVRFSNASCRIILDECHIIKNKAGRISRACGYLEAENTWALSGTPFQNKLEDIYPILRFLNHPCGVQEEFKKITSGKIDRLNANRVQALLRQCMMRRTKKDFLLGRPLIELPRKRVRMVELTLNDDEWALYKAVEQHAVDDLNKQMGKNSNLNLSGVLVSLLRCRQVCNHPFLILEHVDKTLTADDLDIALAKVEKRPGVRKVDPNSGKLRSILQAARKQKPRTTDAATVCQLCSGPFEDAVITKKCRHQFCRECISNAMTDATTCPFITRRGRCGQELDPERDLKVVNDYGVAEDAEEGDKDWMKEVELEWISSTKTLAFSAQLAEWRINHPNDKIVLFSQFTKMLDIMQKVCDDEGWVYTRYQGGMSMEERAEALGTFKSDVDCQVMLVSIKAGGVGLNLTHANLVVCVDIWWNAAVEHQAFDRVHRLGQKKEVFITRFVTKGTVEERMLELQKKKLALSRAAMGEGGAALGKLTREDLLGLFVSALALAGWGTC